MKLVRWTFNNLHMPMLEAEDGTLYCTSKQLCEGLGITNKNLNLIYKRNEDEFETLRSTACGSKEFLAKHKVELGIKRVKSDMLLWSESDMILIAMLSRSNMSKQFRRELVQFVKENAKRGTVSREEYDKMVLLVGQLAVEIENLKKLVTPGKEIKLRLVQ